MIHRTVVTYLILIVCGLTLCTISIGQNTPDSNPDRRAFANYSAQLIVKFLEQYYAKYQMMPSDSVRKAFMDSLKREGHEIGVVSLQKAENKTSKVNKRKGSISKSKNAKNPSIDKDIDSRTATVNANNNRAGKQAESEKKKAETLKSDPKKSSVYIFVDTLKTNLNNSDFEVALLHEKELLDSYYRAVEVRKAIARKLQLGDELEQSVALGKPTKTPTQNPNDGLTFASTATKKSVPAKEIEIQNKSKDKSMESNSTSSNDDMILIEDDLMANLVEPINLNKEDNEVDVVLDERISKQRKEVEEIKVNIKTFKMKKDSAKTKAELREWENTVAQKIEEIETEISTIEDEIETSDTYKEAKDKKMEKNRKKKRNKKSAQEIKIELAQAYFKLGEVQEEQGDLNAAIKAFNRVVQIDPKNTKAHLQLGILHSEFVKGIYNLGVQEELRGRFRPAINSFRQALEIDPGNQTAHLQLGILYGEIKEYGKAVEAFKQILALNPDNYQVYILIAELYVDATLYEPAIDAYKGALKIHGNNSDLLYRLAMTYMSNEDYTQSVIFFKKCLALNPVFLNGMYNLGLAYSYKRDYKNAIINFKKVIEIDPMFSNAYFNIGILYTELQDSESAKYYYDQAALIKGEK